MFPSPTGFDNMTASAVQARPQWLTWVSLLAIALALITFAGPFATPAQAHDAGENKDAGAAGAAAADSKSPSLFMHIVKSVGPVFGIILAVISIALVALIVLLILDLRIGSSIPPGFVEDFTE